MTEEEINNLILEGRNSCIQKFKDYLDVVLQYNIYNSAESAKKFLTFNSLRISYPLELEMELLIGFIKDDEFFEAVMTRYFIMKQTDDKYLDYYLKNNEK